MARTSRGAVRSSSGRGSRRRPWRRRKSGAEPARRAQDSESAQSADAAKDAKAAQDAKRAKGEPPVATGASSGESAPASPPPALPRGRYVDLKSAGSTFVREVSGPPDAPVLLLLHGFIASGGLNWYPAFAPLGEHFRVIAPDLRGHARGIHGLRAAFSFDACADDLAGLLDALGIESAIPVGYSMGGPVAQTLWRRHPERVAGMVLCATSPCIGRGGRLGAKLVAPALTAAAAAARVGQVATRIPTALQHLLFELVGSDPDTPHARWAIGEMSRHDPRMLMEAAAELQRFDGLAWSRSIDVPAACIVTTEDKTVPPESQMLNGLYIRKAKVWCVEAGHLAHAEPAFLSALVTGCRDVAARAASATPPERRARLRRRVEANVNALLTPGAS